MSFGWVAETKSVSESEVVVIGAREYLVRWFRDSPYVWTAMGGGGYSLDAVRRSWSIEFLVMQGADIPAELHDQDPPIWPDGEREGLDEMTDQAISLALKAAW